MADFDAAADLEGALAVGGRVAGHHVAQVGHFGFGEVAADVDAGVVVIVLVGAGDEVGHRGHGAVHHHAAAEAHRAQRAGVGAEGGEDVGRGGEGERVLDAGDLLGLDLVELVVAADEQEHRLVAGGLVAVHDDGLDGAAGRHLEEGGELVDGLDAGGVHLGERGGGGRTRRGRGEGFGQLDVGGVVGGWAVGDVVFAGLGDDVEFVGAGAADRAGVGRHRAELQAEALEDAVVGVVHVAVFALQILEGAVEGVAVLHHEFAAAHHAEARADLVAELHLHLVEVLGQLAVAPELAADHVGDDLLVGRADDEVAVVAVLEA